ncbi:hypothetical protein D3C83_280910 [compost metagenome]
MEAIARFVGCDVEGVVVGAIDLRQRFNEVYGVAFVASELRPNRMSIDRDPQAFLKRL